MKNKQQRKSYQHFAFLLSPRTPYYFAHAYRKHRHCHIHCGSLSTKETTVGGRARGGLGNTLDQDCAAIEFLLIHLVNGSLSLGISGVGNVPETTGVA